MSKIIDLCFGEIKIQKKLAPKECLRVQNSKAEVRVQNYGQILAEIHSKVGNQRFELKITDDRRTMPIKAQPYEQPECKICFENPVELVFIPCSHAVACKACYEKMNRTLCPCCNQTIENNMKVFF